MINNPAGLFSQNQGIFDAKPYLELEQKMNQEHTAKGNALNKYFDNKLNSVKGDGMREQERQGFNDAYEKNAQYYKDNAKQIQKSTTAESFNFNKGINDLKSMASRSKAMNNIDKEIIKIRENPKISNVFKDPKKINDLKLHELPISDPNHVDMDLAKLAYKDPYDEKKHMMPFASIKPESNISYEPIKGDRFNRTEVKTPYLSKGDLERIRLTSMAQLRSDPSFEDQLKESAMKDPEASVRMQDRFQKEYNRPLNLQSDEDWAIAYNLELMPMNRTTKVVKDEESRTAMNADEWDRKNTITFAHQKELTNLRIASGDRRAYNIATQTGYLSDQYDKAGAENVTDEATGEVKRFLPLSKIDARDLPMMRGYKKGVTNGIDDIYVKRGKNGVAIPGFYINKDGNLEGKGGALSYRDAIKEEYINTRSNTKYKSLQGSNAKRSKEVIKAPVSSKKASAKENKVVGKTGKTIYIP